MPVSRLIREFDKGVETARVEYHAGPAAAFDEKFAAFTVYDTSAAEEVLPVPRFKLVPRGRPHTQPWLWKRVHRPLGQILRHDPDLAPIYTGFGTLFTLNRGREGTPSTPDYLSMAIDAPLNAPGMRKLELTRFQFDGPVATRPIPLTAVCLNAAGAQDFETMPIVFYWQAPNTPPSTTWGSIPDGMEAWGHVFVTEAIPEDERTGLIRDPDRCGFTGALEIPDNRCGFDRSVLHRRLAIYYQSLTKIKHHPIPAPEVLEKRLAWTVTYFAYVCGLNRRRALLPKGVEAGPLSHLAIVCTPASYATVVTAALYVPLACGPAEPRLRRAALKALYLARSVGMPLERLRWEERATERGMSIERDRFRHQTSAAIDSVVEDVRYLPPDVLEALGGHFIARLYLLQATIHAYNLRRDPYRFDKNFPYQWQESDCPLRVYCEIGLQLGFARALRAAEEERDVRERGEEAFDESRRPGKPGFSMLMDDIFESLAIECTGECSSIHEHAKNEAFAVLMLQLIKQSVYHTIRAQCRGSEKGVRLELVLNLSGVLLRCKVRNPSVNGDQFEEASRDAGELSGLADLFSCRNRHGRPGRYQYDVSGPMPDGSENWVGAVSLSFTPEERRPT